MELEKGFAYKKNTGNILENTNVWLRRRLRVRHTCTWYAVKSSTKNEHVPDVSKSFSAHDSLFVMYRCWCDRREEPTTSYQVATENGFYYKANKAKLDNPKLHSAYETPATRQRLNVVVLLLKVAFTSSSSTHTVSWLQKNCSNFLISACLLPVRMYR